VSEYIDDKKIMKPNILFLSADNLGDNEIGAVGQKIIKTI
jgi:hypothetical protein